MDKSRVKTSLIHDETFLYPNPRQLACIQVAHELVHVQVICENIILQHIYNQIAEAVSIAYQLYGTISVFTFAIANNINSSCLGNHARKHFLPLILQTSEKKKEMRVFHPKLEIIIQFFTTFYRAGCRAYGLNHPHAIDGLQSNRNITTSIFHYKLQHVHHLVCHSMDVSDPIEYDLV